MKIFRNWANVIGSAAAVLMVATACEVVARAVIVDRNQACVENLYSLGQGIVGYTQDYDERFPPAASGAAFQNDVGPYVLESAFFCPATRNQPYVMNSALAGLSQATVIDAATEELVGDSVVHPNGALTVFFLDGHVEQGGVFQPNPADSAPGPDDQCYSRARQIGTALLLYAQDYDEILPPMDSVADFRSALLPYLRNPSFDFDCPETLAPYTVNSEYSGSSYAYISATSSTVALTDSVPHSDGTVTTLYFDGHAVTAAP